jgi:hypothetical protein
MTTGEHHVVPHLRRRHEEVRDLIALRWVLVPYLPGMSGAAGGAGRRDQNARPRRREGSGEANSSSDPTDQQVISQSPDTPIHRSPMSSTGTRCQFQHNESTERTIP